MRVVLLGFLLAAATLASAALVPSQCPSNNGKFLMHFAGVGAEPGYLADIMFYNRAPNPLEYGSPLGPYFNLQEGSDCYFQPNSSMHCKLNLFSDSAMSDQIGTATLDSDELVVNVAADGYSYLGGYMTLSTTLTKPRAGSAAEDVNYRSQSNVRLYFEPRRTWPAASTGKLPVTNRIDWENKIITLWGSDGWNGTGYSDNIRHTGFDFRVSLTCPENPTPEPTQPPNPVPTPCLNCNNVYTASRSCGRLIEYRSSGNCAALSFSATLGSSESGACGNVNLA